MADRSKDRKKALIMFVLLFLFAGGGIFLYFIIQGANDLTGAGKSGNFTYSGAVRDGISSFFKYIGVADDNPVAKYKDRLSAAREAKVDEAAGVSDWMAPADSAQSGGSASARPAPTAAVPRMSGGSMSGVGGLGAGGTNSSSRISRFGGDNGAGNTSIKSAQASGSGLLKRSATMNVLRNTRAQLGDGLRSGSAMTAKSKWDASFGVGGGGRTGEMAYGRSGLVGLDKIKTGEVDNLKTTDPKSLVVPKPDALPDKDAESKDPVLNKAKQEAADAAAKKAAEQAAIQAAQQAMASGSGGTGGTNPNTLSNPNNTTTVTSPGGTGPVNMPQSVVDLANSGYLQGQNLSNGMTYSDSQAHISTNADGTHVITYSGTFTTPGGTEISSSDSYMVSADGKTVTPYYGQ